MFEGKLAANTPMSLSKGLSSPQDSMREPAMVGAINNQDIALAQLAVNIENLYGRLAPVIRRDGLLSSEPDLAASEKPIVLPPLIKTINDNTERIWNANQALRELFSQLEI